MREEGRTVAQLGIDRQARKDLLGIWLEQQERSKFWLKVLTDLQNRGVKDLLIACTNGLAGFTEALKAAFPKTTPQPCVAPNSEFLAICGGKRPKRIPARFEKNLASNYSGKSRSSFRR